MKPKTEKNDKNLNYLEKKKKRLERRKLLYEMKWNIENRKMHTESIESFVICKTNVRIVHTLRMLCGVSEWQSQAERRNEHILWLNYFYMKKEVEEELL